MAKKVTRTSSGLVDALFDTIDKLNEKTITAEEARAVAHTARSIVGVAFLELRARQLDGELASLKSLKLDVRPIDPPQSAA